MCGLDPDQLRRFMWAWYQNEKRDYEIKLEKAAREAGERGQSAGSTDQEKDRKM